MILEAESEAEAVALSMGCPGLATEGRVEVREVQVFN